MSFCARPWGKSWRHHCTRKLRPPQCSLGFPKSTPLKILDPPITCIHSLTKQSSLVSLHPHPPFRKLLFPHVSLFNFSSIFLGRVSWPHLLHVRTPMDYTSTTLASHRVSTSVYSTMRVSHRIARVRLRLLILVANGSQAVLKRPTAKQLEIF